jgi:hypothetical protein
VRKGGGIVMENEKREMVSGCEVSVESDREYRIGKAGPPVRRFHSGPDLKHWGCVTGSGPRKIETVCFLID